MKHFKGLEKGLSKKEYVTRKRELERSLHEENAQDYGKIMAPNQKLHRYTQKEVGVEIEKCLSLVEQLCLLIPREIRKGNKYVMMFIDQCKNFGDLAFSLTKLLCIAYTNLGLDDLNPGHKEEDFEHVS